MAMVDVVSTFIDCLKSVGVVQLPAADWRCSAFIAWT